MNRPLNSDKQNYQSSTETLTILRANETLTEHSKEIGYITKGLENVEKDVSEIKADLKSINKTVWVGVGIFVLASFLIPIVLNNYFNKDSEPTIIKPNIIISSEDITNTK